MPEKLHRCVSDMGKGMDDDSAWKICNSSISEQVAKSMASRGMVKEHHNPMDITSGKEQPKTQEACKPCEQDKANTKQILESIMGIDEGGVGSGIKGHKTNQPDTDRDGQGVTDKDSPFHQPPPKDNLDDFNTVGEPQDNDPRSGLASYQSQPMDMPLNGLQISQIYNDMERSIDPDMTGDINSGYSDQAIADVAAKYGISMNTANNIWGSGGLES